MNDLLDKVDTRCPDLQTRHRCDRRTILLLDIVGGDNTMNKGFNR